MTAYLIVTAIMFFIALPYTDPRYTTDQNGIAVLLRLALIIWAIYLLCTKG